MNIPVIQWEKSFAIGHEKTDSEHKNLFDIAAKLNKYKNDSKKIVQIIKELADYTNFHFTNEEKFMKSINYEYFDEHRKLHKDIVKALNNTIREMVSLPKEEIVFKLNVLVNKNIVQHILIEDKKFHHTIRSRDELKDNFIWRSTYKLNEAQIDEEHKILFDIALKALDYNNTNISSHLKITIKELYEYMKTHFEHEEEFMEKIKYPNLEEHKQCHQNIFKELHLFLKELPNLEVVDFEKKLIQFIDISLICHILYEDKKIINFKKSTK
ncbi:MAG: hemerythrin domain-containing protein [Arcobacter sp.]|uniref:hemerythrin domain-containing protein n=1 Tax=Arcobacter sp. TaxID=1872629 RepID=UPI003B0053FD